MKKTDNFEKNMQRLEEIASYLKDQNISLDEASKLYEEGMKLTKECKNYIEQKELLIKNLNKEE